MNYNVLIILLFILLVILSILISQYCVCFLKPANITGGGWGDISNNNYIVKKIIEELSKISASNHTKWDSGADRLRIIITDRLTHINASPPRLSDLFVYCYDDMKTQLNIDSKLIRLTIGRESVTDKKNDEYAEETPNFGMFLLVLGGIITDLPDSTIDLFSESFKSIIIDKYIQLLKYVKSIILANNKNNLNFKYLIDAYNKAIDFFTANIDSSTIKIPPHMKYDNDPTEELVSIDKILECIDLYENLTKKCNNIACQQYLQQNNIDKINDDFDQIYENTYEDVLHDSILLIYNKAIGLEGSTSRSSMINKLNIANIESGSSDEDEFEIEDTSHIDGEDFDSNIELGKVTRYKY